MAAPLVRVDLSHACGYCKIMGKHIEDSAQQLRRDGMQVDITWHPTIPFPVPRTRVTVGDQTSEITGAREQDDFVREVRDAAKALSGNRGHGLSGGGGGNNDAQFDADVDAMLRAAGLSGGGGGNNDASVEAEVDAMLRAAGLSGGGNGDNSDASVEAEVDAMLRAAGISGISGGGGRRHRKRLPAVVLNFFARLAARLLDARHKLHQHMGTRTIPIVPRRIEGRENGSVYITLAGANRCAPFAIVRVPVDDIQRRIFTKVYPRGECPPPSSGKNVDRYDLIRFAAHVMASRDHDIAHRDLPVAIVGGGKKKGGRRAIPLTPFHIQAVMQIVTTARHACALLRRIDGAHTGALKLRSLHVRGKDRAGRKSMYAIIHNGRSEMPFAVFDMGLLYDPLRPKNDGDIMVFDRSSGKHMPRASTSPVPSNMRKEAKALRVIVRACLL